MPIGTLNEGALEGPIRFSLFFFFVRRNDYKSTTHFGGDFRVGVQKGFWVMCQ